MNPTTASRRASLVVMLCGGLFSPAGPAPAADVLSPLDTVRDIPLRGVSALVVSESGRHVYATGDSKLVVFARDAESGQLTLSETHYNGFGGVDGLSFANSLVASDDGRHVYVGSPGDDNWGLTATPSPPHHDAAIAIFERDPATGALTFVAVRTEGFGEAIAGRNFYNDQVSLALADDGRHLYATSTVHDAVAVFERDPFSGLLTPVETQVLGLHTRAHSLAATLSGDGRHLYVTSMWRNALVVYARDATTGRLSRVESHGDDFFAGSRPDAALVSPDGRFVYVATGEDWEKGSGSVIVFVRDPASGALSLVDEVRSSVPGLSGVCSLAFGGADAELLYAGSDGGMHDDFTDLGSFARDPVSGRLRLLDVVIEDEGAYGTGTAPCAMAVDPDGRHLYVGSYNTMPVALFEIRGEDQLLPVEPPGTLDGLGGAASLAIDPDGRHLYVAGSFDDALAVFEYVPESGRFDFVRSWKWWRDGISTLFGAEQVALSPNGRHVYVFSSWNGTTIFERNPVGGGLEFVSEGGPTLSGYSDLLFSPDGRHLYETYGSLRLYQRDPDSGRLSFVDRQVESCYAAHGGAMSSDGERFYALFSGPCHHIFVLDRDAASGRLTVRETVDLEALGLVTRWMTPGWDPMELALSPDDRHLYLIGPDATLALFEPRDDGSLAFVRRLSAVNDVLSGLTSLGTPAFHALGRLLLLTAPDDDALLVLGREPRTGDLRVLEARFQGKEGFDGLLRATDLVTRPRGRELFVASARQSTLTALLVEDWPRPPRPSRPRPRPKLER